MCYLISKHLWFHFIFAMTRFCPILRFTAEKYIEVINVSLLTTYDCHGCSFLTHGETLFIGINGIRIFNKASLTEQSLAYLIAKPSID